MLSVTRARRICSRRPPGTRPGGLLPVGGARLVEMDQGREEKRAQHPRRGRVGVEHAARRVDRPASHLSRRRTVPAKKRRPSAQKQHARFGRCFIHQRERHTTSSALRSGVGWVGTLPIVGVALYSMVMSAARGAPARVTTMTSGQRAKPAGRVPLRLFQCRRAARLLVRRQCRRAARLRVRESGSASLCLARQKHNPGPKTHKLRQAFTQKHNPGPKTHKLRQSRKG